MHDDDPLGRDSDVESLGLKQFERSRFELWLLIEVLDAEEGSNVIGGFARVFVLSFQITRVDAAGSLSVLLDDSMRYMETLLTQVLC